MSVAQLRPSNGDDIIVIPSEKITIGRGPFLKIVDKRVSRNHATLEMIDGRLNLTAIHTNPCFIKTDPKRETAILHKGQTECLEPGVKFSLLPDGIFYEVIYKIANGEGSANTEEDEDQVTEAKVENDLKSKENAVDEDISISKGNNEYDINEEEDVSDDKMEIDESRDDKNDEEEDKVEAKVEFSPSDKSRSLPKWMQSNSSPQKYPSDDNLTSESKPTRSYKESDDDEEEYEEDEDLKEEVVSKPTLKVKTPIKRRGPTRKAQTMESDEDDDDDDDEDYGQKRSKKKRKQTQGRRGRRKKDTDEDDDDIEEKSPRKKSTLRKKATVTQDDNSDGEQRRKRPSRAAAQRHASYVDEIVEDECSDDYCDPKPAMTRKRSDDSDFVVEEGSNSENEKKVRKTPGRRGRPAKRGRPKRKSSDVEDDLSDNVEPYTPRLSQKRQASLSSSQVSQQKQTPTKHRAKCEFGLKCYRKNPAHFREACHPYDDSWDENSDEDDVDEGSPQQRKPKSATRPKRAATKTSQSLKDDDYEEDDSEDIDDVDEAAEISPAEDDT